MNNLGKEAVIKQIITQIVVKNIPIFRKLFSNKMIFFPENMENKFSFKEGNYHCPRS